jgi:molybdopterin converting factor small subunit
MSKAYAIYDQLSSPQGLGEQDAKYFIEEGINLLNKVLPSIKLPITLSEKTENNYSDIDTLVYTQGVDLLERVNAKKNILKVITSKKESIKENINIPISSMVAVANQTVNNYILNLDENSKKEFFQIVSEDIKTLETKFETLRESTISKLTNLQNNEDSQDMKTKISETIDKIKSEKFDQLNFLKLKNLEESI